MRGGRAQALAGEEPLPSPAAAAPARPRRVPRQGAGLDGLHQRLERRGLQVDVAAAHEHGVAARADRLDGRLGHR